MTEQSELVTPSRMLVAPCLLLITRKPLLLSSQDVCEKIVQLLRNVQLEWASQCIAEALAPHAYQLLSSSHTQALLSVAMCYSPRLFCSLHPQFVKMADEDFCGLSKEELKGLYQVMYRFYQVAVHLPQLSMSTYLVLTKLFVRIKELA